MKSKILKELKNADDYISGQQLCERLGVSRTAVWKHIKALRAEGYEIDSVTNKGYKLMMEPDLLSIHNDIVWPFDLCPNSCCLTDCFIYR